LSTLSLATLWILRFLSIDAYKWTGCFARSNRSFRPQCAVVHFMLTHELNELLPTKPTRLFNVSCPYCGVSLTTENTTKEHVIGRKFVPKGALENEWNLILNACRPCNNRKSDLEDDISAISMQPDVGGKHHSEHPQLLVDAAHKGKRTRSRYSGKPVADSNPTMQIKYELAPGITMTFNMVGQAQVDDDRLFELAIRHFQAFFFFITYDHQKNRGWFWPGKFAPVLAASRNDWGNELSRSFMKKTRVWETRVKVITARGHFKLGIRKHPKQELWSLAVEWNGNYRVLALCGQEAAIRDVLPELPKLKFDTLSQTPYSYLKLRTEELLNAEDDTLFAVDDHVPLPSDPASY
jgi:hypothetical protein